MKNLKYLFFALLFVAFYAPDTFACVCRLPEKPVAPEEFRSNVVADLNKSAAVFSGKVTKVDQFRVNFKIDKIWRGEIGKTLEMSTGAVKTETGDVTITSCDYIFRKNVSYVVFAYGNSLDDMKASMCTFTYPLSDAENIVKVLDETVSAGKKVSLLHFDTFFMDNYSFYEPDIYQRTEKSHRSGSYAQRLAL